MSESAAPDFTNDSQARSWLTSANEADCPFPIQNLPFAIFRHGTEPFRGGVAIGDQIVDLARFAGGVSASTEALRGARAAGSTLNALMQLGPPVWQALRRELFTGLIEGSPAASSLRECLVPQHGATFALPAEIGDYTDFYTSIHHATAIGRQFRPDNPLLPNYKWVPIGYHGRSSSIGVSGQSFARPRGQRLLPGETIPRLSPSRRVDYELELGIWVGPGNVRGTSIPIADAENHVFGLCLLNDWSARDLQAWEYQPLGPFLAKNFATTVSPWVVTLQALAPFRTAFTRPEGDPQPLPYLDDPRNRESGAIDIQLEALIETPRMRAAGFPPQRLSLTSFRHSYWTISQLIAHHTVNGCNLRPGDLLGTGTQSGPTPGEAGSLTELTLGGARPLDIGDGERRSFLEDGDAIVFRAWCESRGAARVGFGELRGYVLCAVDT